jgi:ketosteroid isomerase-like protein
MSETNLDALRQGIEAWNRHGPSDAAVALAHPDSVLYPFPEWPDDSLYRGRDGWLRLMEQWTENFDDITWEIEKVIDDDPTVALLVNHRATVKGTGVPLVQPLGLVVRFQDGMVIEGRFFLTWNEALEASGLLE